jgi:hypothetical protein
MDDPVYRYADPQHGQVHDSRRRQRNDFLLALIVFEPWVGRKTQNDAFAAVARDDPGGGGHRKRLGEFVAKVKPAASLYYRRVDPETDPTATAAITAEIARAVRTLGGNPDTLDLTDTWQINRALEFLGADIYLLATIGSWGDTLLDNVILDELRTWNAGNSLAPDSVVATDAPVWEEMRGHLWPDGINDHAPEIVSLRALSKNRPPFGWRRTKI